MALITALDSTTIYVEYRNAGFHIFIVAESHYGECRYADCRGAQESAKLVRIDSRD
jgi:hypothetical protein